MPPRRVFVVLGCTMCPHSAYRFSAIPEREDLVCEATSSPADPHRGRTVASGDVVFEEYGPGPPKIYAPPDGTFPDWCPLHELEEGMYE